MMSGGNAITDPDAIAFLAAAGITNQTIGIAINTLVTDLKGYGVWAKMKAIYPFVGGTATTHKFNLKDPQDLNAAFRLVFSGGWTHSANGAQPNAVNGYADTFAIPSSHLNSNSHLSCYLNTIQISASFPYVIGSYNSETQAMAIRTWGSFDNLSRTYNYSGLNAANTALNSDGFWLTNIEGLNQTQLRNNVLRATGAKSGSSPTATLTLSALNAGGSPTSFSSQRLAIASIGDALTTNEATNFYSAVQAFQTTLGRQV